MKRSRPASRLLAALSLTAAAAAYLAPVAAHAQFTFIGPKQSFAPYQFIPKRVEDDIIIQTAIPGGLVALRDHIVGFDSINEDHTKFLNPTSPTLRFIANPMLPGAEGEILRNTLVFNESELIIAAGGIVRDPTVLSEFSGVLRTYDMSKVTLSASGAVPTLYAFDRSKVNTFGGRIENLLVLESATTTIEGGEIKALQVGSLPGRLFGDLLEAGTASATIKSGTIGSVTASTGGSVSMTGGTFLTGGFNGFVSASGEGEIAVANVNVPNVQAKDDSMISMSGGRLGSAAVLNKAVLSLSNVEVTGGVTANGDEGSLAVISGGVVSGALNVLNKSLVTLTDTTVVPPVAVRDDAKLQLQSGASLSSNLTARDDAVVTIFDGSVQGAVEATANSSFVFAHGTINGNLRSIDNAKVEVNGGIVLGSLSALGDGANEIAVTGGEIHEGINIFDSRKLVMTGGTTSVLELTGIGGRAFATVAEDARFSEINVTRADLVMLAGVRVVNSVHVFGLSVFHFGKGTISGDLIVQSTGMVDMSDGFVGGKLRLSDDATMTMSGGDILFEAEISDRAKLTWTGGVIGGSGPPPAPLKIDDLASDIMPDEPQKAILPPIRVSGGGQLNIVGVDLVATLIDPDFEGMFSLYELAGRLADGTNVGGVTFLVKNGTGATFQLLAVPEPGSLALAALALAAFAQRRPLRRRPWQA